MTVTAHIQNPNEHDALLAELVAATKADPGYMFMFPTVAEPLLALGFAETNANIIDGGKIATRATTDGIKHVTLVAWEAAKLALDEAKARENELRLEVVALFSDANKVKGTENVALDDGYKLKIVKKQNFSVVKKDADGNPDPEWIDKVETALDRIEDLGPQYKLIADRLIKWDADVSVSEYNKLADLGEDGAKIKEIIGEVIEIKDGTPTVELVEPKAKK